MAAHADPIQDRRTINIDNLLHAIPWEDDGTFSFSALDDSESCDGSAGAGAYRSYPSVLKYFVRFRAQRNGQWVESKTN